MTAADDLREAVEVAWRRARAAHPSVRVIEADFAAFALARVHGDDRAAELARRHAGDLYLACACAREDPAALAAFEALTLPAVERGLAGLRFSADARRELLQVLREKMLVARDGERGIVAYDGRAPLAMWLRVCAVRLGRRQEQRDRRVEPTDDATLAQLAPGVPDPELAYMRRHYGAQFQAAFRAAVAALAPRERNLLRHAVIDGLGIDQIAGIYHVHRATAARQLKQARVTLVDATREHMRAALRVSEAELESILRVIMSTADITLRRVLAAG